MRIAHTSDLHIDSEHPERWDALKLVLEKAKGEKVDYLVIAGDLFDDVASANENIAKLRSYFSGSPFKTIVIPGNHDFLAFETERDLGDNVVVLSKNDPIHSDPSNRISFFTVPYLVGATNEYFYEKLAYISKNVDPSWFNIFVFHGDLDEVLKKIKHRKEIAGAEEETAFSLSLKVLQKFPSVQLVLSGHYHTFGEPISIGDSSRLIVYSGAPVSITRNDLGTRYLLIYDVDPDTKKVVLNKYPLETFYFEKLEIYLTPTSGESIENYVLSKIESSLSMSPSKTLILELKGYISSKEQGMSELNLKEAVKRYCEEKWTGRVVFSENWFLVLDVGFLLDKPFSQSILEQIDGLNDNDISEEDKRTLKQWFLSALSQVYSPKGKI